MSAFVSFVTLFGTAVVHFAGVPDPDARFDDVLPANILSTTYLVEAARKAKVGRFVFASSAQTIEGYPVDRQIVPGMAVAPANLYGVSKCYGEALCSLYATRHGMSCVSLRIGAFEPADGPPLESKRDLSAWLSHRDATHLIDRAIQAEINGSFIAHGISDNRFKRLDLTETCKVLGYAPQDDAFSTFPMPSAKQRNWLVRPHELPEVPEAVRVVANQPHAPESVFFPVNLPRLSILLILTNIF